MRAIRTPESNVTLTIPEEAGGSAQNDLPAHRIMAYDASRGQTPKDAHAAIQSVWQLTPQERRQIVGGAMVELIIWGNQHPPVSMEVGDPTVDLDQAIMDNGHVGRALARLYANLTDRMETATLGQTFTPEDAGWPDAEAFIALWEECVAATNREIAQHSNGQPTTDA